MEWNEPEYLNHHLEESHLGRVALSHHSGPRQNHSWHVRGKKGVGDEADIIEAATKGKMVKAVVTEVKGKTCYLLSHWDSDVSLMWQLATAPQFKAGVSVPALNSDG